MADKKKTKLSTEDIRAKSPDELNKMLVDLKKQQMNMRFQKAGGQLNNTAEIRVARRDVARIKTVLTQKETTAPVAAKATAKKPAAKAKKPAA